MDNRYTQRAIDCEIIEGNITDPTTFANILKVDWIERSRKDPSLYVMAQSNATEEQILESGKTDFENEFLPRLKKYIKVDSKILEIGCGIGRMSYYIASICKELIALDISHELLKIAYERLRIKYGLTNINLFEGNGIDLNSIEDDIVDIVFEYIVFQHIPSQDIVKNYIKEINRVLKVGGVALLHGRDVQGVHTDDNFSGNTWHGAQFGHKEIRDYIQDTSLCIINEEGIETERYWVLLEKK